MTLAEELRQYAQVGSSLDLPSPKQTALAAADLIESLEEQLEAALRERDAIGTALGEPCAECGHVEWRSDGYADAIMQRLRAADEAVEGRDALLAEADAQAVRYEKTIAALEKDRDSWAKIAREYETALADRGAL